MIYLHAYFVVKVIYTKLHAFITTKDNVKLIFSYREIYFLFI